MYRIPWPTTGLITQSRAIRLGGIVHEPDLELLDDWIVQDDLVAVHLEELRAFEEDAVRPFVGLVRRRSLLVHGNESSRVFADLERAGLARGRELIAAVSSGGDGLAGAGQARSFDR
jgi:hypothetical protein